MDKFEITPEMLALHRKWVYDEENGVRLIVPYDADLIGANLTRADLTRANLTRADLREADLTRANLREADLRQADLREADLTRADLREADLRGADLRGADLREADLREADLTRANLTNTVLDPELTRLSRAFALTAERAGRHGGRIVYRTVQSIHVGDTQYAPGHTYVAPILSWSHETDCHPGIYAMATADDVVLATRITNIVRCYVRDGEYVVFAKGIRCARLRVLNVVK